MATAAEKFEGIKSRLETTPEKTKGIKGTIQFDLAGDGGGQWYTVLNDGTGELHEGLSDTANTTISMNATDFVDLTEGKLDATMAFMSGKLKVKGDMGLAMKLQGLLR
ncbi:MAG: SCP2 sterol-binding domain-containing protein [Candidatus Dormibacteria bacterium]